MLCTVPVLFVANSAVYSFAEKQHDIGESVLKFGENLALVVRVTVVCCSGSTLSQTTYVSVQLHEEFSVERKFVRNDAFDYFTGSENAMVMTLGQHNHCRDCATALLCRLVE
jgi:hypothetical protein